MLPDSEYYSVDRLRFLRDIRGVMKSHVEQRVAANERMLRAVEAAEQQDLDAICDVLDERVRIQDKLDGLGHKLIIVGLASLLESLMRIQLKQNAPGVFAQLRTRSAWGEVRKKVEYVLGCDLARLPGWNYVHLTRCLANDFKHRDGFADLPNPGCDAETHAWCSDPLNAGLGFEWGNHVNPDDGKVDYAAIPLDRVFDGVEAFLKALEDRPVARST